MGKKTLKFIKVGGINHNPSYAEQFQWGDGVKSLAWVYYALNDFIDQIYAFFVFDCFGPYFYITWIYINF